MTERIMTALYEERIDSRSRIFRLPFLDLLKHRDLLMILVRRDLEVKYRLVRLWPLWLLLQPFLAASVLALVFGFFVGISTEGVTRLLFYLAGFIVWNFFSRSFMAASKIFSANRFLFSKIYFPRLLIPLSGVLFNFIELLLPLGFFLLACVAKTPACFRGDAIIIRALAVGLLFLEAAILALGTGLCIAAVSVKIRDAEFASGFLIQLGMFLSPVLYPVSIVPARWKILIRLNPMTEILEGLRWAFFGTGSVEPMWQMTASVLSVTAFFAGMVALNWAEYASAETS